MQLLTYEEQNKVIDKALKQHYRESMECKRVPTDYLLMFTEGGESNAVADAIARAQLSKDKRGLLEGDKASSYEKMD